MKTLFTYRSYLLTGVVLLLLGLGNKVVGTTKTASVTGNWNATGTWGGAAVPVAGDNIIINTGITVTVNVAATALVTTVVINSSSTANGITISGSNILNCGAITLNSPTAAFNSTIAVGAGTLNATSIAIPGSGTTGRNCIVSVSTGTINVTGDISFSGTAAQAQLTFTGAGTLNLGGNLGSGGSLSLASANITLNGTGTQSISGFTTTGNVSMTKTGGTATFNGTVNGAGLTMNGSGGTLNLGTGLIHTFSGGWTRTAGALNGGSSTLKIAGSTSGTGDTFNCGTGTVEWNGSAQTVAAVTYNNLILSGSGVKTMTGVATVTGNFTLNGDNTTSASTTVTLNIGGNFTVNAGNSIYLTNGNPSLAVTGNTHIYGTVTSGGAGKTFTGDLTIYEGGSWTEGGYQAAYSFYGSLTNNGSLNTNGSGGGINTFYGSGKTLNGDISILKATKNGSSSYTNLGIFTVGTALSGSGTLIQGTNSTLNIGGTIAGTLSATASGNTVNYYGAGAQTVSAVTYNDLTLSGSGTKTTTGATINGILSMEETATALDTPTYGTAATLQYKGSSAQTTGSEFPATFSGSGGVIINNANGVALGSAKTIVNRLTMNSGTLDMANTDFTIGSLTGSANLTHSTGTAGTRTLTIGSDNTSPAVYSGAISDGTATAVALTKNGTGTLTLSGANTYTGTTTVSSGILCAGNDAPSGSPGAFGLSTSAIVLGDANTTINNSNPSLYITGAYTVTRPVTVANQATTSAYRIGSNNSTGTCVFSGAITMNQPLSVRSAAGGTVQLSGTITANSNKLTQTGMGKVQRTTSGLILSGDFEVTEGTYDANGQTTTITGLTTVSSGVYQTNTATQTFSGGLTISGGTYIGLSGTAGSTTTLNLTLSSGTLSAPGLTGTFNVTGNWSKASGATFTTNSGTVTFNGSGSGQLITGTSATTFNNLTINNSAGVTLGGALDATVTGTLTFTSGKITTGANKVMLDSSANAVSGAGTGKYIYGNLQWDIPTSTSLSRTFPVGDQNNYAPATIAFTNVTVAGSLTGSVSAADHSQIVSSGIDASKSVNHTYTFTNSGITFTSSGGTASATLNWVGTGTDAEGTPANYIVAKYDGSVWTRPTVANPSSTSIQATGLTSFSDFQVGVAWSTVSGDYFKSLVTGSWSTSGTWLSSPDDINWGLATLAPTNAAARITVQNGHLVTVDATSTASTLVINGTLAGSTNSLSVSGNLTNNGTFTANTGLINLNGTSQLLTGSTTFTNLTLSNSGAKTISPATINGTLSLEGEATTAGTTPGFGTAAAIRYKGSVAQTTGIELPATFSGTGGVTIDNSNGVTLEGGVLKTIATGSNLTITTGAFTIPPTGQLTVQGTITNSVGNTGLVLQSSASGTASLIQSNASVPATIERYIPGAAEAWHFLSAPVAAQAISGSWVPSGTYGNGTGYDLYVWNEPTKCWIYKLNTTATVNWNIVHPQTSFVAGRGYLYAVQASNPTKSFAGNLNTGAINYSLTLTNDTNRLKGFNFVGNPYSSSVDWAAASGWTRTALETSGTGKDMWIWNESAGNYGIYNSADGDGVGTNGVTRYIAPMQGFFVKAATAGNLGFSDAIRVQDGAGAWKSAQINSNVISAIVTSEADQSCDEVRMLFGYPPNLTGTAKLFSHLATAPSLYLPAGDANFTVRYLTDTVAYPAVPVQFKPGRNGDYTLSFNFDESTFKTVLLEDRPLKVLHDLRSDPTYRFRAAKKDQVNRFILHLAPVKALTREELPARIFTDGEKILIDLTAVTGETTVCVYDLVGRKRYDRRLTGETQHTLNFNPGTQPLIIQLKNPQGTLCRKILCNNTSQ